MTFSYKWNVQTQGDYPQLGMRPHEYAYEDVVAELGFFYQFHADTYLRLFFIFLGNQKPLLILRSRFIFPQAFTLTDSFVRLLWELL